MGLAHHRPNQRHLRPMTPTHGRGALHDLLAVSWSRIQTKPFSGSLAGAELLQGLLLGSFVGRLALYALGVPWREEKALGQVGRPPREAPRTKAGLGGRDPNSDGAREWGISHSGRRGGTAVIVIQEGETVYGDKRSVECREKLIQFSWC